MLLTKMCDPFVTKPCEPVFVRDNQYFHSSGIDSIHESEELFAAELHPAADFFHKLYIRESTGNTKFLQGAALLVQIGALALTADTAIYDSLSGS